MSRGSNEAGDSSEFVYLPLMKPKTNPVPEAEAKAKVDAKGYDVDWDNLDFNFPAVRFEWASGLSARHTNIELLNLLIETAIDEENEETGTKLEFVKYVSANVLGVQGFLFYITFWAKDLSSPDPEPKLYQAKVRKFADEIIVSEFRLRSTQE
ncbi:unnamed protein product [Arabidopsis halleri]